MYFSLSKRFVLFVSKANLFFHRSINIKSFSLLWMKKQIKEVANCGIPDNKSLIKNTRKTFRIVNLDRRSIEVLWHRLLLCRHRTGNCLWNSILQYFRKKRNCQKQQNWQKTEKAKFCLQYSDKRYRIIKVIKKGSPYLQIRRTFFHVMRLPTSKLQNPCTHSKKTMKAIRKTARKLVFPIVFHVISFTFCICLNQFLRLRQP